MMKAETKMKILIMPSWYKNLNGTNAYSGIFHWEQALELSKYCDVAIYYLFDRTLEESMDRCYENGILTYRSKFQNKWKIRNWFRAIKTFRQINKEFTPDVIYAHVASEIGRYAVILGKIFRKPIVITEHSALEYSGMEKGIGKMIGRFVYSNSRYNVCVSDDLQKKMQKNFPKIDFCTIYNGVIRPEVPDTREKKYRLKGSVNIALVALLYSMDIKGIQYVIPAIRQLNTEGYTITMHIVGDGNYLKYFQNMAVENGVLESFIFHGYCPKQKVYEIINEMDFLLSASLIETFGCTLAEAMMLGKPVLATKSGGPDSFVNDKVGILIEAGSTEAIVAGIKDMIARYDEFDSEYIKEYAYNKFEMKNVCQAYMDLFKKIVL